MRVLQRSALLLLVLTSSAWAKGDALGAAAARYVRDAHGVLPSSGSWAIPRPERLALRLVPSFARQTGMACHMCHYQFPQLTPFGRQFKLNGYTLSGMKPIEDKTKEGKAVLQLQPYPPVSLMLQASATQLATALPGTQNFTVAMPQQLGVLFAGAIGSNVGAFTQVTWSPGGGTFEIDNVDIRYADRTEWGGKPVVWGLTLNNSPSAQDLWNTTPTWGYPFASSGVAPSPMGETMVAGGLAQRSVGLGAYAMWNDLLYAELSAYRTSVPGAASPLDASARGTLSGFTPYWRLALQRQFGDQYLMIGTFGLSAKLFPAGVTGPTDDFTDIAFDAQHEMPVGDGHLVSRLAWISESQTLASSFGAGASANRTNTLNTLRLSSSWYPSHTWGLTASVFSTSGTADTLVYAPGSVSGSANGKPQSNGASIEASYNLWENARLSLTYTMFGTYNGGTSNYDGSGRSASANNSLYVLWWFAF